MTMLEIPICCGIYTSKTWTSESVAVVRPVMETFGYVHLRKTSAPTLRFSAANAMSVFCDCFYCVLLLSMLISCCIY